MAHTPGPWLVGYWSGQCTKPEHAGRHPGLGGDNPCIYDPVFVDGVSGIAAATPGIMVVSNHYDELVISDDDALLLAAAPDLLAAAQQALSAMRTQDRYDVDAADALEAAITKAIA